MRFNKIGKAGKEIGIILLEKKRINFLQEVKTKARASCQRKKANFYNFMTLFGYQLMEVMQKSFEHCTHYSKS
jgi:hypothetical protein